VVTGHRADGRAVVLIDDLAPRAPHAESYTGTEIWQTAVLPVDNTDDRDGLTGIGTIPQGCTLRYGDFEPGFRSSMHTTPTIDYAIVIEGVMEMELDDGTVVTLNVGDVVVQRGTNHRWMNNSDRPVRMAFAMIAATDRGTAETGAA
jgi:quercetin dioxygenase-like cupin family protein